MGTLIRIELRKACRCKPFIVALAICLVFAVLCAVDSIGVFLEQGEMAYTIMHKKYAAPFSFSPFTTWLPVIRVTFWSNLFVFVAPLLICFAYSWSLRSELLDGYAQQVLLYTTRTRLYVAKMVAVFVAGGLIVALPLLVNFVCLACFMPFYQPNVYDATGFGMYDNVILADMFYGSPFLFVLVRTVMDFVLGGLWATLVLGLSLYIRNRIVLVVLPYIWVLLLKFGSEFLYAYLQIRGEAFSLIDLLRVTGDAYIYTWGTLLSVLAIMACGSVLLPLLVRKKDVL